MPCEKNGTKDVTTRRAVTVTSRNRTEPNVPVGATVDRDGVYRPIGTESAALSYADSELANGGS